MRDLSRVVAVTAHPVGQRADAAQREPAVEGRGHRALHRLNETDALKKRVVLPHHNRAAQHVAMPRQIFGRRVHDEVGPQRKNGLQARRGPGVVAGDARSSFMRDVSHGGDVGNF